jgi:hypothetical protein
LSTLRCSVANWKHQQLLSPRSHQTKPPYLASQLVSTGLPLVLLPPLRTKVNAVHAGLSPQLVPSKVPGKSKRVNYSLSPNPNSLIASRPASVAAVETKPSLSTTGPTTSLNQRLLTHTFQFKTLVLTTLLLPTKTLLLLVTSQSLLTQFQLFKLPLPSNQSLSQLRLTPLFSNPTLQVSLTALNAVPLLTTPSSQLVTEPRTVRTTGSSRTHGALAGVSKDISRLPPLMVKASAVSKWLPFTHSLHELYPNIISTIN